MGTAMDKFLPVVRTRAVGLVLDKYKEHPSYWATIVSVSQINGCSPLMLLDWIKKAEIGNATNIDVLLSVSMRLKTLEQELRQANEILHEFCDCLVGRNSTIE